MLLGPITVVANSDGLTHLVKQPGSARGDPSPMRPNIPGGLTT
jgi:hypothetical protein